MTATGEVAGSDEIGVTTLSAPEIRTSPMPNGNGNHKTSNIIVDSQPKRRVSIISDVPMNIGAGGYDNPAFEQNPRRKISQVSRHRHPSSLILSACATLVIRIKCS